MMPLTKSIWNNLFLPFAWKNRLEFCYVWREKLMYQTLYRKYRSQTFEEMVGQGVVTTPRQAIDQGKSAMPICSQGPKEQENFRCQDFAKAMVCSNQFGESLVMTAISVAPSQRQPRDVIEIDAPLTTGLDEIRIDIRDKSTYAPAWPNYKVYIIDEVHMLSMGAFNALWRLWKNRRRMWFFWRRHGTAQDSYHSLTGPALWKSIKVQDIERHLASILDKEGVSYDPCTGRQRMIARRPKGGDAGCSFHLGSSLSFSVWKSADLETTARDYRLHQPAGSGWLSGLYSSGDVPRP